MSIYAKVIADSISPTGTRLTTVECQFHRFILPEVNTHRAFSRNSASSRAIPTQKLIDQVRENPAYPVEFGTNQPGMQAGVPFNASMTRTARIGWRRAADQAADMAESFLAMKVHKQVVNRLLEPFMWHKAIISSTEAGWTNFFNQRCNTLAQPEIQYLACDIHAAIGESVPVELGYGDWHLPYVDLFSEHRDLTGSWQEVEEDMRNMRAISAARCARVSYLTHDGVRDVSKDLELYDKLVTADPPHWSPLEHVATPGDGYAGNFHGWDQLRHRTESQ